MRLCEAINNRDYPQVEALLKAGAYPNDADTDDSLLMATAHGDKPMVRLLLKYGANPSRSLLAAQEIQQAKAMLELGANVNSRVGYDGDTPLMSHASSGNVELVKFLLQHGANATLKSQREAQQGESILDLVDYAAGNHPEMAVQYRTITKTLTQAIALQSKTPEPQKN